MSDRVRCGTLGGMRMLCSSVHFQFLDDLAAQPVVREHSLDGLLDYSFRVLSHQVLESRKRRATWIARVMEVLFQFGSFPRDFYLSGVHYNHKIAEIRIRCEGWFMLAAQKAGNFGGNPTEGLAVGINNMPFLFIFRCFEESGGLIH